MPNQNPRFQHEETAPGAGASPNSQKHATGVCPTCGRPLPDKGVVMDGGPNPCPTCHQSPIALLPGDGPDGPQTAPSPVDPTLAPG
jgi:hypothetical protein